MAILHRAASLPALNGMAIRDVSTSLGIAHGGRHWCRSSDPNGANASEKWRRLLLHYSARNPQQAAFYNMLKSASFADKVQFHFTQEQGQRANIRNILESLSDQRDIYVCGPNDYIHDVLETARELGWPEVKLHREFFSGSAPVEMGSEPREAFQVKIASTGEVFEVALKLKKNA